MFISIGISKPFLERLILFYLSWVEPYIEFKAKWYIS